MDIAETKLKIIESIPERLIKTCCSSTHTRDLASFHASPDIIHIMQKLASICSGNHKNLDFEDINLIIDHPEEAVVKCYRALRRALEHGCTSEMAHALLLMCLVQHGCKNRNTNFSIHIDDLIQVLERGGYLSYDGKLMDSLRHSPHASCTFVTGSVYHGGWTLGRMNGSGMLFDHEKTMIYKGEFLDNEFSGIGEYFFVEGGKTIKKHRGNWLHNMRNGFGTEASVDLTEVKNGYWQQDTMLGFGEHKRQFIDADGNTRSCIYIGNFHHSQYSGLGLYSQWIKQDDTEHFQWSYLGFFTNGKRNGPGYVITEYQDKPPCFTCNFNMGLLMDKGNITLHELDMYQTLNEQLTKLRRGLETDMSSLLKWDTRDDPTRQTPTEIDVPNEIPPIVLMVAEAGGSCLPRKISRVKSERELSEFIQNKQIPNGALWTSISGAQYSTAHLANDLINISQNLLVLHRTSEESTISQSDCRLWTPFCKDCRSFMLPHTNTHTGDENTILHDVYPAVTSIPGQTWICQGKCSKIFWTCSLCTHINEIQLFHISDRQNHFYKKHNSHILNAIDDEHLPKKTNE